MNGKSYSGYWSRGRLSRRRLLATGAAGSGALALSLGAAGCAGRPASQSSQPSGTPGAQTQPNTGGTLNLATNSDGVLDAQKTSSGPGGPVSGVQSRLFRFITGATPTVGQNHDLENDLGVSAESPDAVTWTIKLRPDAKFQNIPPVNGHAVEAEDIKSTFQRALDPATSNPNRGSLLMIDPAQIQTPDKQTIVFKLLYPYSPFHKMLGSTSYSWIFPREAYAGAYDPLKTVIGSGPFLIDSIQPSVATTVKRNPDWFDKPRPYLDGARTAVIPDTNTTRAQFGAGNLDTLVLDNTADFQTYSQANPKATVVKAIDGRSFPLYLQLGDLSSPFQDVRVRRALSMAIDRETIGKAIFSGESLYYTFVPGYMGKWAVSQQDVDPSTQQYFKYNPTQAKQMLSAAGQSNLELKVAYVTAGFYTPAYQKQAETIANMLNQVGIKTTLVAQDYVKDFIGGGHGSRQGNFDKNTIGFFAEAVYSEADDYLYIYFHSKSTSNGEKLNDPKLDAMIDKERAIPDENERLKAVQDIEKYIADQMYVVPTVGTYSWTLVNPRIQNYQYSQSAAFTETYTKLWLQQ
jgi:peptide/nickel transport system substrate-binding protein